MIINYSHQMVKWDIWRKKKKDRYHKEEVTAAWNQLVRKFSLSYSQLWWDSAWWACSSSKEVTCISGLELNLSKWTRTNRPVLTKLNKWISFNGLILRTWIIERELLDLRINRIVSTILYQRTWMISHQRTHINEHEWPRFNELALTNSNVLVSTISS